MFYYIGTYFDDCIILLCYLIMHFKPDFFHRKEIRYLCSRLSFPSFQRLLKWKHHCQPTKSNNYLHVTFIWYRSNSNSRDTELFFSLCVISGVRFHVTVIKQLVGRREKEEYEKAPQNFHMAISEFAFKLNNEVASEFVNIPLWQNLFYTVSELKTIWFR